MMSSFSFRRLSLDNLDLLIQIQEEAFADLDDASLLRRNSLEMLRSCLVEPNVTLGAYLGDVLAAFSVLFVPDCPQEDLSLSLVDVDRRNPSANNKLCIVRPPFRGNNLQLLLGRHLEDIARQRGFRRLCATASPLNIPSCRNLSLQGYALNRTLEKYGVPRHLFFKNLF